MTDDELLADELHEMEIDMYEAQVKDSYIDAVARARALREGCQFKNRLNLGHCPNLLDLPPSPKTCDTILNFKKNSLNAGKKNIHIHYTDLPTYDEALAEVTGDLNCKS